MTSGYSIQRADLCFFVSFLQPSNAGRLEYSNYPLLSRGIMEGISQLDIKAVASEGKSAM